MCEKDEERIHFINEHYPDVLTISPKECETFVKNTSDHGGADVVLEIAGAESTFRLAWECARPNAIRQLLHFMIKRKAYHFQTCMARISSSKPVE